MVTFSNANDLGNRDLIHTVDRDMVEAGPLDDSINISDSCVFIDYL